MGWRRRRPVIACASHHAFFGGLHGGPNLCSRGINFNFLTQISERFMPRCGIYSALRQIRG